MAALKIFIKERWRTKQRAELTKFKDNPVRFLSRAGDGTFCFTNNGEIYTMKEKWFS